MILLGGKCTLSGEEMKIKVISILKYFYLLSLLSTHNNLRAVSCFL